jgi:hypothetical protein
MRNQRRIRNNYNKRKHEEIITNKTRAVGGMFAFDIHVRLILTFLSPQAFIFLCWGIGTTLI